MGVSKGAICIDTQGFGDRFCISGAFVRRVHNNDGAAHCSDTGHNKPGECADADSIGFYCLVLLLLVALLLIGHRVRAWRMYIYVRMGGAVCLLTLSPCKLY